MRAEKPHGACRVLAPDVIHSDSDNYFSGAKKTAVTSESLISVCSHFQPLNHSCEINIYMSQIPVEAATLCLLNGGLLSDLCCIVRCAFTARLPVL